MLRRYPFLAVAIVVVIVVFALGLRGLARPFVGLMALMVVYIMQPGELYPALAPLHLERVLAVVVLASFFFHRQKLRFPTITRWMLALYGVMILAIPLAFWRGNSIEYCLSFAEIVVFHLLIVALLTTEERVQNFMYAFIALIGWLGGSSMLLYLQGVRIVTMGIERATGITSSAGDPNTLGITLVSAMPLEFLIFTKARQWWAKLLAVAIGGISLWTIISTGSRTSFFAFGLCLLLILFADFRKRWKLLPVLLVLAPLLWFVIPQQYKARYETVNNLKDDDSYQNRILSWKGGVQMFLHNPATGVGPNNYASANGDKYWPGTPRHYLDAHNLFFKLIGELGIFGLIAFTGYVVQVFRTNARLLRQQDMFANSVVAKFPLYCNISLIILLFAGYSGHNLYRNTWYILGALTAAIALLEPEGVVDEMVIVKADSKPVGAWVPGAVAQ